MVISVKRNDNNIITNNEIKGTVPVVIGALGLVRKGLGKYVEKIPGNRWKHQYRGTPKDQATGYSPSFTKSAVYKLNNDSLQPLPRKLVASRSPGQYKLQRRKKYQ